MTQMSSTFHHLVRHTVACHSRDGKLQSELEKIRQELLKDIPEGEPDYVHESPVVRQRRNELAYIEGYMSGPAPVFIDRISVEAGIEQRPKPTVPAALKKYRKKGVVPDEV